MATKPQAERDQVTPKEKTINLPDGKTAGDPADGIGAAKGSTDPVEDAKLRGFVEDKRGPADTESGREPPAPGTVAALHSPHGGVDDKPDNTVSGQIKAAQARKAKIDADAAAKEGDPDELIWVNVPAAFKLNVGYIVHNIKAGEQLMMRKWAEMSYAKANGVTILGADSKG